ncbi:Transmembrane 9 superfamily member 2 [Grifola frondosa]|uniref:Transmembrane 9 superfamily member n=1 Tax=Grifola frondosa TaxID=5627 RepID=A0A1C7LQB2_GRIFR|nr:Transmembrane 9 superfamily member 2 [Grifola frondosa]
MNRRRNSFLTATILPTVVFAVVFFLNLFLISAGSSGAVPFGTLALIIVLWFGISAPLSAIGSYFGTRHGAISHPVRVNQIPRQIPPTPRYLKPWIATLLAGILPFGAAFVELYFVLSKYRWHWRAFLTGGGSAFWVLAYGIFYWASRLSLDSFSSVVLYMGYLLLLALLDFLVTGTIGFLASYWAIRRLYSAIRVD